MELLLIYRPQGMEGWVGLVGWPIADALPTKWSHVNHGSGVDQGKRIVYPQSSHVSTTDLVPQGANLSPYFKRYLTDINEAQGKGREHSAYKQRQAFSATP